MDCWLKNPAKNLSCGDRPMRSSLNPTGSTEPGDASNGQSSDAGVLGEIPTGPDAHDPDAKTFTMQHKPNTREGFNLKDNLALLEQSIADLNRNLNPESFGSAAFPPRDKADNGFGSYQQTEKGESGKERLLEENTLDLLQSLDIPGSLSDLDEFCATNAGAFFPSLAAQDMALVDGGIPKEDKADPDVNNTDGNDKTQHNLGYPVIKTEKDTDYIQLCTPGVIKQENERRGYCQMAAVSVHHGSSSRLGSDSQSCHYAGSDAFPLAFPTDGWIPGYGDAAGMYGAGKAASQPCPSSFMYSRPEVNAPSSSASSRPKSSASKTCLVCSDEASGCHYGVLTCGSCKVFFKRAVEGWRARQSTHGQHNYLCAGRNDCIIDKIRRKNCPACRFRRCLQAGMNLDARKNKKMIKLKGQQAAPESSAVRPSEPHSPPRPSRPSSPYSCLVLKSVPLLVPNILNLLRAIEPDIVHAGCSSSVPNSSIHIMTILNRLGGRQFISAVKWAKALPGFRNLHLDDQMTLLQCSWLYLMCFSLGWRSYQQCNGRMLCFAPDLVINEERMNLPYMSEQCKQMLKISDELVRLRVSYEEFLCMKVLLLLSTVPNEGLKSQAVFDDLRLSYIKVLGKAITLQDDKNKDCWKRFYNLTKLMDSMQEVVAGLLNFCFYTFVNKSLSVEFPEMLAEIISNQIPQIKHQRIKPLLFHQK